MLIPVIMAGGSGTRLWPLSRALYPKQFLELAGNSSMLQETVQRLEQLDTAFPVTICNEDHRFIVAEQLRSGGRLGKIILEPEGRNTAPAIAVAVHIVSDDEDPVLLVLAADHVIADVEEFTNVVTKALPLAEAGKLVTFGIVPTSAHTGYGYIKRGKPVEDGFAVDCFVEKPDASTAEEYVASQEYYWNSGMFLFKSSVYLQELAQHRPDIAAACEAAVANIENDLDFIRLDADAFRACPDESIDYAVMEKTEHAVVVPLDAGWNDIGSWSAMWDVAEKDESGNASKGDVIHCNSKDCYVYGEERLVTTIGLKDTVIVDTQDALLVAARDSVQDVKSIVAELKKNGRDELKTHREVFRPWGKFDSIDIGERYQVKRITVKPGAKLSLQMHHHRAEHWIVVSGTAQVTNGDKTFLVSENQSTYIPVGVVHSLENPGKLPLELIEVQSGSYLGEDDIVRFEDNYGRLNE
ncbi:mannose-1-phosphate guanylyltransferase/mannose-6-phosphate isomerase [Halodesulfovibrio sp.]|uniref:mannose-1-phosphate guanylyltransferase/mannose-6-phosphate isomerase n=1 Tax=Halodesulfovibrio sp. TaxID=1912772 RepID=UPI0025DB8257|nr:mannose-1-phosphate guanylyltransferase/mannose-6-phosphate isomerase [Halodesulfovibrio sp.]MCT4535542.1 mannose-1-phosphate guanylyltransferase/mannose-6-phosphate isomerase [Halodesulfovibrio sp.]